MNFSHTEDDFQTQERQKAILEKQKMMILDFIVIFQKLIQFPVPAAMPSDMPYFLHQQERDLALWNHKSK